MQNFYFSYHLAAQADKETEKFKSQENGFGKKPGDSF